MSTHDFSRLYDEYPAIIAMMPATFTRYQFIRKLSQQYQKLYIEALYSYRDTEHETPFMTVHGILAKRLVQHPELVTLLRRDAPSKDIFGESNECAEWAKV
jgi:hypothetical protein